MKKTLKVNGTNVPVIENNKFSLHLNDWLKALLIAVGAPVADYIISVLQAYLTGGGAIDLDWRRALSIAVSAALIYITKNFFSKSTVTIAKSDL